MIKKYRLSTDRVPNEFSTLGTWRSRLWTHFFETEFTRIQAENVFLNYTCSMRAERVFDSMLAAGIVIQMQEEEQG